MKRHANGPALRVRRLLLLVLAAGAFAACDRVVDLTPAPDGGIPDAHIGNDGGDGGIGDAGIGDGGIDDGGGALPDASLPDA